jgi:hypothetical protein
MYALTQYAMRRKRDFNFEGPEGIAFNVYLIALVAGMSLSHFKPVGEKEGGGAAGLAEGGEQASRVSMEGRKTMDARKSVWEGGRKGAAGIGGIKSVSKRGLVVESPRNSSGASGDDRISTDGGEVMFNPGFI